MACPSCKSDDKILEENTVWCKSCGHELESAPQWLHTYATPSHYKRFPVYSRIKRFLEYVQKLNKPILFEYYVNILDIFSMIEFQWAMRNQTKRKYFYNKYVVLYFIVRKLQLEIDVRTLKDKERVDNQVHELSVLLNHGIEMFD